ncbi:MAG: hypothetical protein AB4911_11640 [Oscillochloridaceae bacterium umkhey_bin13]
MLPHTSILALTFSCAGAEDTRARLEQIRSAIHAIRIIYHGQTLEPVTVSIGFAKLGHDENELIRSAD